MDDLYLSQDDENSFCNPFHQDSFSFDNYLATPLRNDFFPSDQIINQDYKGMFINNTLEQDNLDNPLLEAQSTGFATGKIPNLKEKPISDKRKEGASDFKIEIDNNNIDESIGENCDESEQFLTKKIKRSENKKCGRKFKNGLEKGNHTKNSEDNMIMKIKITIINSVLYLLNNSFIYGNFSKDKSRRFLKIQPEIYTTNKKDKNIELLRLPIKTILNNEISKKNSTATGNHNKKLIQDICKEKEKKETDIINILNLTFGEFLNLFRGSVSPELETKLSSIKNIKEKFMKMEDFIEKVWEQEKNKGETKENINTYIIKLKNLCMNYEKWFNSKKGRERK